MTPNTYSRSDAARLLQTSRPTLIALDEIHPDLAPKRTNKTQTEYTLSQLAQISRLNSREPDLTIARDLGIAKHQLLDFYCELPTPITPTPSPSDFSKENNLSLSIAEQLRLLADGINNEIPRNLQHALKTGIQESRTEIMMIAAILASLQSKSEPLKKPLRTNLKKEGKRRR